MSGAAIAMMIVAILIIWGGLVFALVNLSRHPEEPEDDAVEQAATEEYRVRARAGLRTVPGT